jgi:hypothetical protein
MRLYIFFNTSVWFRVTHTLEKIMLQFTLYYCNLDNMKKKKKVEKERKQEQKKRRKKIRRNK